MDTGEVPPPDGVARGRVVRTCSVESGESFVSSCSIGWKALSWARKCASEIREISSALEGRTIDRAEEKGEARGFNQDFCPTCAETAIVVDAAGTLATSPAFGRYSISSATMRFASAPQLSSASPLSTLTAPTDSESFAFARPNSTSASLEGEAPILRVACGEWIGWDWCIVTSARSCSHGVGPRGMLAKRAGRCEFSALRFGLCLSSRDARFDG
jgi:hypothetical protein